MGLTSHINLSKIKCKNGASYLTDIENTDCRKKTNPLTDSRFKISMKLDLYPHA